MCNICLFNSRPLPPMSPYVPFQRCGHGNSRMSVFDVGAPDTGSFFADLNGIIDQVASTVREVNNNRANSKSDRDKDAKPASLKDNPGEIFKDVSYDKIKKLQEDEKKIADLQKKISAEKDAKKKEQLREQLEELKGKYEETESDTFNGNNPASSYGKKGSYNFYTNLSEKEYGEISKRNGKFAKMQSELNGLEDKIAELKDTLEKNKADLIKAKRFANATDKKEKARIEAEIKKLENKRSGLIARMNKASADLKSFIKKAGADKGNTSFYDVAEQNDRDTARAQEKKALDGVIFDDKGKLKGSVSDDVSISCDGKELDKEKAKEVMKKLLQGLGKDVTKDNISSKIEDLLNDKIKLNAIYYTAGGVDNEKAVILNEIVKMYTDKEIENILIGPKGKNITDAIAAWKRQSGLESDNSGNSGNTTNASGSTTGSGTTPPTNVKPDITANKDLSENVKNIKDAMAAVNKDQLNQKIGVLKSSTTDSEKLEIIKNMSDAELMSIKWNDLEAILKKCMTSWSNWAADKDTINAIISKLNKISKDTDAGQYFMLQRNPYTRYDTLISGEQKGNYTEYAGLYATAWAKANCNTEPIKNVFSAIKQKLGLTPQ